MKDETLIKIRLILAILMLVLIVLIVVTFYLVIAGVGGC